jgi:hypothetical protein
VLTPVASDLFGWYPDLEVDTQAATPVARVCTHEFTDAYSASCHNAREPRCASGGTITLSRLPAPGDSLSGLVATFDATFDGGFGLAGTIVVPWSGAGYSPANCTPSKTSVGVRTDEYG